MEQIKEGQQINLGLRKAELESFHAPKQLSGPPWHLWYAKVNFWIETYFADQSRRWLDSMDL